MYKHFAYNYVTMVIFFFFLPKVTSLSFKLSSDPSHEKHGMIIEVEGRKPRSLERPVHIAMDVTGASFWGAVSSAYGDFAASMAR